MSVVCLYKVYMHDICRNLSLLEEKIYLISTVSAIFSTAQLELNVYEGRSNWSKVGSVNGGNGAMIRKQNNCTLERT